MPKKQNKPKWLLPIGILIFLIGLIFMMYLVITDVNTEGKEFLIVSILALIVGGSFSFIGGEIGMKTKASDMTGIQLAGLDSFTPFLAMRGGIGAFIFVFVFGIISYVQPEVLHTISENYFSKEKTEEVEETGTKTTSAAEIIDNVVEKVQDVVEEVKEVVKEEPKYEPPVNTKGPKTLGF